MADKKNFDAKNIADQLREANENREALSGGFVVRTSKVLENHGLTGRVVEKNDKGDTVWKHAAGEGLEAVVTALGDGDKVIRSRVRQVAYFSEDEVSKVFAKVSKAKVKGINNVPDTLVALNRARKDNVTPLKGAERLVADKRERAAKAEADRKARDKMTKGEIVAARIRNATTTIVDNETVQVAAKADSNVREALDEFDHAGDALARALEGWKPAEGKAEATKAKAEGEKDAGEALADMLGNFDEGQTATLLQLVAALSQKK